MVLSVVPCVPGVHNSRYWGSCVIGVCSPYILQFSECTIISKDTMLTHTHNIYTPQTCEHTHMNTAALFITVRKQEQEHPRSPSTGKQRNRLMHS